MNFIRLLSITKKENRYIIAIVDYFIKYLKAKVIKEIIAKEVSKFIYKEIICKY